MTNRRKKSSVGSGDSKSPINHSYELRSRRSSSGGSTSTSASRCSESDNSAFMFVLNLSHLSPDHSHEQTWFALLDQCRDKIDDLIQIYAQYHDVIPTFCNEAGRPCESVFRAHGFENTLCACYLGNNLHFFNEYFPRILKAKIGGVPDNFAFPSLHEYNKFLTLPDHQPPALTKRAKHRLLKKARQLVQPQGTSFVPRRASAQNQALISPAPGEHCTKGLDTNPGHNIDPYPNSELSPSSIAWVADQIAIQIEDDTNISVVSSSGSVVHSAESPITHISPVNSPNVHRESIPFTLDDSTKTSQVDSTEVEFTAVDSVVGIRGPINSTPKPSLRGTPSRSPRESPTSVSNKSPTQTTTNDSPNTSTRGTPLKRLPINSQPALYFPYAELDKFGCLSNSLAAFQKYCNNKNINFKLGDHQSSTYKIWPERKQDTHELLQIHTLEGYPFKLLSAEPNKPIRYIISQCPQSYGNDDIKRAFRGVYHIVQLAKKDTTTFLFSADRELEESTTIKSRKHKVERYPIELVHCVNCFALGHNVKTCREKTLCGKCAHEHKSRYCNNPVLACARCYQAGHDGSCAVHNGFNLTDCPIFKKAQNTVNQRKNPTLNKSNPQPPRPIAQPSKQIQKHTPPLNRGVCPPPQQKSIPSLIPTQTSQPQQHKGSTVSNQVLPAQTIYLAAPQGNNQRHTSSASHTITPHTHTTEAAQQVSMEQRNSLVNDMREIQRNFGILGQMCNDGLQERYTMRTALTKMTSHIQHQYNEISDLKTQKYALTQRINHLQQWQQSMVPDYYIQEFKQYLAHRQEFTNFLSNKYN